MDDFRGHYLTFQLSIGPRLSRKWDEPDGVGINDHSLGNKKKIANSFYQSHHATVVSRFNLTAVRFCKS